MLEPLYRLRPHLLLLVAVFGALGATLWGSSPSAAQLFQPSQPGTNFMVIPVIGPPPSICVGEKAPMAVSVIDLSTGLPVPQGDLTVERAGGGFNPAIEPPSVSILGGVARFTYTALDEGRKSPWIDNLTFKVNHVLAQGTMPVMVTRCQYDVDLYARHDIYLMEDEADLEVKTVDDGEGQCKRAEPDPLGRPSSKLEGEGTLDVYMTLSGSAEDVECRLVPDLQGTTDFTINGEVKDLVPNVEEVRLNFEIEPIPMASSQIVCSEGFAFPFSPQPADPNELGLKNIVVILEGSSGTTPIGGSDWTGQVTVRKRRWIE